MSREAESLTIDHAFYAKNDGRSGISRLQWSEEKRKKKKKEKKKIDPHREGRGTKIDDDQIDRVTKCLPGKEDIAVVMLMKELLSTVQWFDR